VLQVEPHQPSVDRAYDNNVGADGGRRKHFAPDANLPDLLAVRGIERDDITLRGSHDDSCRADAGPTCERQLRGCTPDSASALGVKGEDIAVVRSRVQALAIGCRAQSETQGLGVAPYTRAPDLVDLDA